MMIIPALALLFPGRFLYGQEQPADSSKESSSFIKFRQVQINSTENSVRIHGTLRTTLAEQQKIQLSLHNALDGTQLDQKFIVVTPQSETTFRFGPYQELWPGTYYIKGSLQPSLYQNRSVDPSKDLQIGRAHV